ncbi:MAG: protein kinase domain-containing protein [Deltaproteobacteria bacterium]
MNKQNLATFPITAVQTAVGWATIVFCVGMALLFGLQWVHNPKLDSLWVIIQLHNHGDPLLSSIAPYLNTKWPPTPSEGASGPSISFLPLAVALGVWVVKLVLNLGLVRARKAVAKLVPAPKEKTARRLAGLGMDETEIEGADTEEAREELLKRYREIEGKLKAAKRKTCSFLAVDVAGSTQMKVNEREASIAATFQAYEEMVKKIFKQYGAWKEAWTPDGVMVCFLQADLAVAAGIRIIQRLKKFNENDNKLRTPFKVRCGVNEGEVQIFEDSKLEKIADRVIDVAGHMQKQARPDTLWLSTEVYDRLADKAGFRPAKEEVDGFKVYEWSTEPMPATARPAGPAPLPPKPAMKTMAPAATPILDAEATMDGALHRIGRYEIMHELGRGAMGAVYQARDPQIGRIVAIKVIMVGTTSPDALEEYKQRFYREAQTAGAMSHPGIVTIYDMAEDVDGNPYLVMEFVEGTTLDKILAPAKPDDLRDPVPLKQKLDIAAQVADALDYAHRRKVIHRDIKPANILVTPEGKAKIADFGIAKMAGTHMTHTGLLVGTPAFMSPEQITGGDVDSRSDIFSFGVLAYWMMTGQRPFPGDAITQIAYKVVHTPPVPMRDVNPNLPLELEPIIFKCLAKKPDQRYQAAREIAADFETLKAKQLLAGVTPPGSTGGR